MPLLPEILQSQCPSIFLMQTRCREYFWEFVTDATQDERDPEYTLQNTADQHVYLCVCVHLVVLDDFLRLCMLNPTLHSRDRIRVLVSKIEYNGGNAYMQTHSQDKAHTGYF